MEGLGDPEAEPQPDQVVVEEVRAGAEGGLGLERDVEAAGRSPRHAPLGDADPVDGLRRGPAARGRLVLWLRLLLRLRVASRCVRVVALRRRERLAGQPGDHVMQVFGPRGAAGEEGPGTVQARDGDLEYVATLVGPDLGEGAALRPGGVGHPPQVRRRRRIGHLEPLRRLHGRRRIDHRVAHLGGGRPHPLGHVPADHRRDPVGRGVDHDDLQRRRRRRLAVGPRGRR